MAATHDATAAERVEAVLAQIAERAEPSERPPLEAFARAFLEGLDAEDMTEREALDLYGAIRSLWQAAAARPAGEAKVRVFNPSVEEQGWQSPHTVVEIVNDDMPFLVDSVQMEVLRQGLAVDMIAHPIATVRRDANGRRLALAPSGDGGGLRESLMHVEVERIADAPRRNALAADIGRVLADVRAVVDDWAPMRAKMLEVMSDLEREPPPLPEKDVAETRAFLAWLADNHFTFVGYRCHDLVERDDGVQLAIVAGTGLGVLHERTGEVFSASFAQLPSPLRAKARARDLVVITKSNSRSTVHRPGYLDYIGIKRYDRAGNVCGEHRFLGLYTSMAYSAKPTDIPLLRHKVGRVLEQTGFAPHSHSARSLANILATYPRDELIQVSETELARTVLGILKLEGRQRFRLFLRRDCYERFVSCLIYAPRERYTTELRLKWQAILVDAFRGTGSEFAVLLSESALVRVLVTVRTHPGGVPAYDANELERRLAAAMRRWEDDLADALVRAHGEGGGGPLFHRYAAAFPAAYREDFPARVAVPDIALVESALASGRIAINLYRPVDAAPSALRFKLVRRGGPMPLSNALPMLERMGLTVIEERPYRVSPDGAERVWIHDYGLIAPDAEVDLEELRDLFEDAFLRVFEGAVENDGFNRLVLAARLSADEVVVLRAYGRYLRQIGFPLSQWFIEETLAANAGIARMLVALFRARFDPDSADAELAARQANAVRAALEKVANLSEDRVLRQYLATIEATLRSSFWRKGPGGEQRPYLSLKLDPAKVPGMPAPAPMFEIWVYSPRFEGVHLRGGKVARGGLRWSDRPEDFRTEVLGLVKAQMVKNTVIVPVGSKGGFVLKRAPSTADRDAYLKEGVACYQDYLRALLDLTDNREGGAIVPPPSVRRHDPDDPYLVVAADKGTASFSDYANAVSAEYGFWLGDAFASGGSAGYDHKRMGITARGAWEAVKRHFREMGVDTQAQQFSVVGIGDMSGDVFGNGMLCSPHIRLVAAFDHRHVFIDPSPDAAASFAERRRLFDLPRSSWADYDEKLISQGGGVWPRAAKSIPVSPEACLSLGLAEGTTSLPPNELVSAMLRAPVDLLYNGGIGTYVKASDESHAEVGDRGNDGVRIDATELRCKVVAEGGNLGFTQRGRVEYARAGGRINTDAIDNSGGVDTSDHEVNIKILLGMPIAEGALTTKQRNELLSSMTDEVAALVLSDNYEQTQILSVGRRLASRLLDDEARFIRFLEREGRLHREIEFLPDDDELARRATRGEGLTTPERAVLLAYAKLWLYDQVLASPLPDEAWVARALTDYFPPVLVERFGAFLPRHPLSREIIATVVVNRTINRAGAAFVHRMREATGAGPSDVVRAHLLVRETFALPALWREIEALDMRVADDVQAAMLIETSRLAMRGTLWFLRSPRLQQDLAATVAHFAPGVASLAERVSGFLAGSSREEALRRVGELANGRVPEPLAGRIATLEALTGALDIVETAAATGQDVAVVAGVHYAIGDRLALDWLSRRIAALPAEGHWQGLARGALRDDVAGLQRALTVDVLRGAPVGLAADARLAAWEEEHRAACERAMKVVDEVRATATPDLAMISVALRELRNLVGGQGAGGTGAASLP